MNSSRSMGWNCYSTLIFRVHISLVVHVSLVKVQPPWIKGGRMSLGEPKRLIHDQYRTTSPVVENQGQTAGSIKSKILWLLYIFYFLQMEVDVGLVIEDLGSSIVFCRVIEHLVSYELGPYFVTCHDLYVDLSISIMVVASKTNESSIYVE